MITDEQLGTLKSHLDIAYQNKDFNDHNFPTPVEIVDFVDKISQSINILAERNIEWLLSNKVKYFLSDCNRKQDVLKFLQDKMKLKTKKIESKDLNSASSEMDYKNISLRTNYPFNDESTGNLKANIWPELLQKDWERGYKSIECIISDAWTLADTSNTGNTNREARKFILPKLNWLIWNPIELFKPHAIVSTVSINIDNSSSDQFDVYGYKDKNFYLLYKGNKKTDFYIFRNNLSRKLYKLQQEKFGLDYVTKKWNIIRNQFPKDISKNVDTFSLNSKGERIKQSQTNKVDPDFGSYRVSTPLMRNSQGGRPWFDSIGIVYPNESVKKDYSYIPVKDKHEAESFISLVQTKFVSVMFEDTLYSRTFTAPTMKFVGKFPFDRKWTTKEILKYLNNKDDKIEEEIDRRYQKGFKENTRDA